MLAVADPGIDDRHDWVLAFAPRLARCRARVYQPRPKPRRATSATRKETSLESIAAIDTHRADARIALG
jgi:hypothetical protein